MAVIPGLVVSEVGKGTNYKHLNLKRGNKSIPLKPNITLRQIVEGFERYDEGVLIQDAFPFLTPDEREFMMTGITPEEWDRLFGEEEC